MSSKPVVVLEDVVVAAGGRALSLELFPGDAMALMGPATSARSALTGLLTGGRRPVKGRIQAPPPGVPRRKEYTRWHTPQNLAKRYGRSGTSSQVADVLGGLGLWDQRQSPVPNLDPAQQVACDLLPAFLQPHTWVVVDGQFDRLDPWAREAALGLVKGLRADGTAFVVETNLECVAEALGSLVVFSGASPVYAGTVEGLLRATRPTEVVVETSDPTTVASMVDPFAVSVSVTKDSVRVTADKGQELAARLLTEGYGRVRAQTWREPTLAEALRALV